jgi:hypothetical protein
LELTRWIWMLKLMLQQKTMRTTLTGRKVDERNQCHYEYNGLFWFPRTSVISYYYNYNYNTTLFWELPLLYNCLCMLLVMHPWLIIAVPLTFKLVTIFLFFIIYWLTTTLMWNFACYDWPKNSVLRFHFVMLLFTNGYFD